jgi:hypothetical protein
MRIALTARVASDASTLKTAGVHSLGQTPSLSGVLPHDGRDLSRRVQLITRASALIHSRALFLGIHLLKAPQIGTVLGRSPAARRHVLRPMDMLGQRLSHRLHGQCYDLIIQSAKKLAYRRADVCAPIFCNVRFAVA